MGAGKKQEDIDIKEIDTKNSCRKGRYFRSYNPLMHKG